MTQAELEQAQDQDKKTIRLGDYILTGKIGQGGVAEIFKGRQESLDRDVAIKILSTKLTSDPDIVRRFERESLVIAKLNHPNIVHVIDKGSAGGRYYFVMEYINGTSLREIIDTERIALNTKLEMVVQVCKALDYAHKNGVIHRDIKPTNILIDRQGNALVADFGIAQIIGTPDSEMTSSDVIMGTMAYMSPEQKVSSTNVDQTTDIYAVGIMLYEILVGKKPLGHFKLPTELNSELNPAFNTIIQKCLAQEPKDRYQQAVELKDALLELMTTGGRELSSEVDGPMDSDSFLGKCRHLDTIRETRFSSTILVENKVNKQLYVIKKHSRGEAGRLEAKLLSTLKHKNIINILGSGGDRRSTVVISEYAQGGSLADRMARKYGWEQAFQIGLQIAAGLDHAHKQNVVHGNLSPSDVLFDSEEVIKLTDFGMPSQTEQQKKKNWCSPPELKKSRQGDIYSLGAIIHRLVTGRTPTYDSSGNLRLDDVKLDLPSDVANMLTKLLSIRVARRYKSCQEFLLDWEDFERMREERKKMPVLPLQQEPSKSSRPVLVYALVGVGVVVGVVIALYLSGVFH
jgi:serine/threonine-protein kinase